MYRAWGLLISNDWKKGMNVTISGARWKTKNPWDQKEGIFDAASVRYSTYLILEFFWIAISDN